MAAEQLFSNILLGSRGGAVSGGAGGGALWRSGIWAACAAAGAGRRAQSQHGGLQLGFTASAAEPRQPKGDARRPGVEAVWRRPDCGGARRWWVPLLQLLAGWLCAPLVQPGTMRQSGRSINAELSERWRLCGAVPLALHHLLPCRRRATAAATAAPPVAAIAAHGAPQHYCVACTQHTKFHPLPQPQPQPSPSRQPSPLQTSL